MDLQPLEPNPDQEAVTVTLEIAVGDGPIRGALRSANGSGRTFAGWMDLVAALEHERARPVV